ncbi:LppP/LprE family lipoprotein [Corynebacterium sp. A21]|uniref:LppP/LprE family lipoprotein n=1 Tax=Corynebacterium sp. A21 TaxID=3457318 RepID=UPI003FD50307
MSLRSFFVTIFAVALAFGPAACSATDSDPGAQPPSSSTVTSTAPVDPPDVDTPTPSVPVTTAPVSTALPTDIPIEDSEPPTDCALAELDLVETEFGAWLNSQIIPTNEPGTVFYIDEIFNQFNPCSELSFVTLHGQNGDRDHPAGTGSALAGTAVFFNYEHLITSPAPIEFRAVPSGERINDSELEITYGHAGGATAEGVTELLPIHYRMEGAQLLGNELIPAEHQGNLHLDLTRAGPPGVGVFRPFGNAHFRPWDQELPVWNQYAIMMGEERINCDFPAFNGEQLTCYDEYSAPWPVMEDSIEEAANIATMNFRAPWQVSTSTGNPPEIKSDFELLPDESTTRVGNFFIQTYGDVIIIHDVNWAYRLGVGIAEPVEVPSFQLDISRHPQDLLPWEG